MPVQSTTNTGRSLLGEALHWTLPRLAGYVLAALASVLAFTIWAAIYTYVWPGRPAAPTPVITPVVVPPTPTPAPGDDLIPGFEQLIANHVKGGGWVSVFGRMHKAQIYDTTNAKVGLVEDVLVGPDGKIIAYIIDVGGFVGRQSKDIAVPFSTIRFKVQDNTLSGVLSMPQDAVRNAPAFKYDAAVGTWVLDTAQ